MPRITVTADSSDRRGKPAVLLDEHVQSIHLSSGHAAAQLVERLAWAIIDAEQREGRARRPVPAHEHLAAQNATVRARERSSSRPRRRVVAVLAR
jgi:hypothetical protein